MHRGFRLIIGPPHADALQQGVFQRHRAMVLLEQITKRLVGPFLKAHMLSRDSWWSACQISPSKAMRLRRRDTLLRACQVHLHPAVFKHSANLS
jgi:hypothetical protein